MKIQLSSPDISDDDIRSVVSVLKTPNLSLGPVLERFERQICKYSGAKYAVAVNSGTSALHLIIKSFGIGVGDEVITTPFSFISSSNCVLYEGAKPVFVDIDPKTYNIDPDLIESKINKKTKAILAVDVFAQPADWDSLRKIANKHGLILIEDSAEALGSEYKGKKCGTLGDAGIFSFYPNKQITTGEGGVIVTNNKTIAEICQSLSNQGRAQKNNKWLDHARLGYNYRMSDINAALGLSQLDKIKSIIQKRSCVASLYNELLKEFDGVVLPHIEPGAKINWFVYTVKLSKKYSKNRTDKAIRELVSRGIECHEYFRSIHLQPLYRKMFGYKRGDFPICEAVSDRAIALPFFNSLSKQQIKFVVRNLKEVLIIV
ncbi:MAG: DegT/DnrJ/EryC1/StrS family aminotransferase [Candidatus Margulisiibacteriota bacterium]